MKFRADDLLIDPQSPFKNDALGRQESVEFLSGVIGNAEGPLVLAIDSAWGTGKTTLIRMLQCQLENSGHRCEYFNAWEVDFSNDPLLALVSKIDLLRRKAGVGELPAAKKLKRLASLLCRRAIPTAAKMATAGLLDIDKELETDLAQFASTATSDLYEAWLREEECLSVFRLELGTVIDAIRQKDPAAKNLVLLVDELDRCRPSWAIHLLERLKHLFDTSGVVFVMSVDKVQLEECIKSVYGSGINAREYLRRFFDLEFSIPRASSQRFVHHLMNRDWIAQRIQSRGNSGLHDKEFFVRLFSSLAEGADASLRVQAQCISRLALLLEQTPITQQHPPALVATLLLMRALSPDTFARLLTRDISTDHVLNWVANTTAWRGLDDDDRLHFKALLRVVDPNPNSVDVRLRELADRAKNESEARPVRDEAEREFEEINRLRRIAGHRSSLQRLIQKIDLVNNASVA